MDFVIKIIIAFGILGVTLFLSFWIEGYQNRVGREMIEEVNRRKQQSTDNQPNPKGRLKKAS